MPRRMARSLRKRRERTRYYESKARRGWKAQAQQTPVVVTVAEDPESVVRAKLYGKPVDEE